MTPKAYKNFKISHKAEISQLRAEIKSRKDNISLKKQEIKEAKAKMKAWKQEQKTATATAIAEASTALANRVNVRRVRKLPSLFGFLLTGRGVK